jgi:hypothetical protein
VLLSGQRNNFEALVRSFQLRRVIRPIVLRDANLFNRSRVQVPAAGSI